MTIGSRLFPTGLPRVILPWTLPPPPINTIYNTFMYCNKCNTFLTRGEGSVLKVPLRCIQLIVGQLLFVSMFPYRPSYGPLCVIQSHRDEKKRDVLTLQISF